MYFWKARTEASVCNLISPFAPLHLPLLSLGSVCPSVVLFWRWEPRCRCSSAKAPLPVQPAWPLSPPPVQHNGYEVRNDNQTVIIDWFSLSLSPATPLTGVSADRSPSVPSSGWALRVFFPAGCRRASWTPGNSWVWCSWSASHSAGTWHSPDYV